MLSRLKLVIGQWMRDNDRYLKTHKELPTTETNILTYIRDTTTFVDPIESILLYFLLVFIGTGIAIFLSAPAVIIAIVVIPLLFGIFLREIYPLKNDQ